jgi:NifU-like protein involved in Fe-S cluster formation
MLNDVYNSRILDLAGNIPRLGRLPEPDASATAHSKLCGSTVTIDLKMDGPVVKDLAHDVKACALGQASSSLMARHVVGAKADELRDLRSQMLLRLQAVRVDIDQPRQLRQADHTIGRGVGDMRLAEERHHVMLAVRIEADVPHQDEIVIARGLAKGAVKHLDRAFVVALVDLAVGVDHALWRVEQAFARRIVAGIGKQRADRFLGLFTGRRRRYALRRRADVLRQFLLCALLGPSGHDARLGGLGVHSAFSVRPAKVRTWAGVSPGSPRQERRRIPRLQTRTNPSGAAERHLYIRLPGTGNVAREIVNAMLNDVYNSRILDLAGNIPRLGRLPDPDASATAHSKLCGSTVTIDLKMDGPVVKDFAHDVKACALGQASSSLMARHVVGAKAGELRELREMVRKMLKENGPPPNGKWADFAVLEPVRDYKARHASTLLTFDAVVSALDQIDAKSGKTAMAAE